MKEQATLQNLSDFENKSLLICDDDNPFRERLARAMEKKGFEVFQAESVQKGIEAVKAKKPGFAVVDLRLGDGNGLEVVKEIQSSKTLWICSHFTLSADIGFSGGAAFFDGSANRAFSTSSASAGLAR